MMNAQSRMTLLIALAGAGATAFLGAGCSDQGASQPVSQRTSPTADKMAAETASATDKATTMAAKSAEDDAISAKVKAAIVADPGLSTLPIDVDTKNSVVTLNGTVDTAMSKERAEQIAQAVGGVRSVIDNLTVKSA